MHLCWNMYTHNEKQAFKEKYLFWLKITCLSLQVTDLCVCVCVCVFHPYLCDSRFHGLCGNPMTSRCGLNFQLHTYSFIQSSVYLLKIFKSGPLGLRAGDKAANMTKHIFSARRSQSLERQQAIEQPWECSVDECYEGEVNGSKSTKCMGLTNSKTKIISQIYLQRWHEMPIIREASLKRIVTHATDLSLLLHL